MKAVDTSNVHTNEYTANSVQGMNQLFLDFLKVNYPDLNIDERKIRTLTLTVSMDDVPHLITEEIIT